MWGSEPPIISGSVPLYSGVFLALHSRKVYTYRVYLPSCSLSIAPPGLPEKQGRKADVGSLVQPTGSYANPRNCEA